MTPVGQYLSDDGFPEIDFSGYGAKLEGEEEELVAAQFVEILHTVGFCRIVNPPGVGLEDIESSFDLMKEFFEKPIEEKRKVGMSDFRGYSEIGEEVTKGKKDVHECLDLLASYGDQAHLEDQCANDGKKIASRRTLYLSKNLWPGGISGFETHFNSYTDKMVRLGDYLLQLIAIGLGMKSRFFFRELFGEEPFWILRLLAYPQKFKNDSGDDFGIGVGEHYDYGAMTILYQDQVGGLQIQTRESDDWLDVPYKQGSYVINIGEALQALTDGYLLATNHRVLSNFNPRFPTRYSLPFFFEPSFFATVRQLVQEDFGTPDKFARLQENTSAIDFTSSPFFSSDYYHAVPSASPKAYTYGDYLSYKYKASLPKTPVTSSGIGDTEGESKAVS